MHAFNDAEFHQSEKAVLPQSFLIVQTDDPDPELVTSRRLLSSKLLASVPEERMRIVRLPGRWRDHSDLPLVAPWLMAQRGLAGLRSEVNNFE